MSRVLLIGRGPLPSTEARTTSFSQLRTAHFYEALRSAGHEVRLALLGKSGAPSLPPHWAEIIHVEEEGPGWLDTLTKLAEGSDLLVAAGPYNPSRAACLVAGDRPVWADLPGDPFAELHALAQASNEPLSAERIAAAEAAALPVLARADAISVISNPQRHALMGELGAVGRLLPGTLPNVHTIPIANPPGAATPPTPRAAGGPLVVALSGAFNPWFDDVTVARALQRALENSPLISVVVTGGGLHGFYEEGYRRFERWAAQWPQRVRLLGWVPHGDLPEILGQAHVGISMDRPGPEPELGSRTRLLSFVHHGLMPIATTGCELAQEMGRLGELVPMAVGDAASLSQALEDMTQTDGSAQRRAVTAAQARLQTDYDARQLTSSLIEWSKNPTRTLPAELPAAALATQLAQERDALAQVHTSPTWRTLSILHRLIRQD